MFKMNLKLILFFTVHASITWSKEVIILERELSISPC